MKFSKKILTLLISMCLVVLNTFVVKAISDTTLEVAFSEGYDSSQGKLEIVVNEELNTFTEYSKGPIEVSAGDVLKFRLIAEEGYEVNFDNGPHLSGGFEGVAFEAGEEDVAAKRALLIGEGYEVVVDDPSVDIAFTQISFRATTVKKTSTMSISIESEEGSNLEYWIADIPSRVTFMLPGTKDIEFGQDNLTWKDGTVPAQGVYAKGVSTKENIEVEYDYDNSGNVSFLYHISNATTKITSLKINDIDYTSDKCPSTDEEILANIADGGRNTKDISFDIPFAEHYDVEIVAAFHDLMGGFGWNYLPEESPGGAREDCIAHGTLEFVSGQYGEAVYNSVSEWNNATLFGSHVYSWIDGDKDYEDEKDAWGSAAFPKGAIITMKLVPDEGYQLVSLYGDENIEPQDETGVYTITMKGGMNSHLMATFVEVDDEVNVTASNINNGTISNVENTNGIGTMRLDVADIESQDSKDNLDDYAAQNDSEVLDYLSIELFNTVYKANDGSDTWDDQISELDNPATITLHINEDYSDKQNIYIIHDHEGEIRQIPATCDDQNNTITFETDKFSDYGIAFTAQNTITTTTDGNGKAEPESVVVEKGDSEIIVVTPNEGYVFDYVDAQGIEEGEEGNTYSILYSGWPTVAILVNEMPDNNVKFNVHFAPAVKVVIDPNGGIEGPEFESERIIKKGQKEEAPFEIWDDFLSPPEGKELDYVEINGEKFDPDKDYTFNEDITVRYIWKDASGDEIEYDVKDDDKEAEMIFVDEDGHEYMLMVFDLLNLSDEDYKILDIDKKEAEFIINQAKKKIDNYKDVLSIYMAQLVNLEDDHFPEGPIKLRIKVGNKLNGYDNLRIIDSKNLFDDETFDPEIIKSVKVVDSYIEIMMPDLSYNIWALSGRKKSDNYIIPTTGIQ